MNPEMLRVPDLKKYMIDWLFDICLFSPPFIGFRQAPTAVQLGGWTAWCGQPEPPRKFFLGGAKVNSEFILSFSFFVAKHSSSFYIHLDRTFVSINLWTNDLGTRRISISKRFKKKQNMLRLTLWRWSFLQQNPWYPGARAMWLMTRTKTIAANKFTKNDRRNWIHASKRWHFLGGANNKSMSRRTTTHNSRPTTTLFFVVDMACQCGEGRKSNV